MENISSKISITPINKLLDKNEQNIQNIINNFVNKNKSNNPFFESVNANSIIFNVIKDYTIFVDEFVNLTVGQKFTINNIDYMITREEKKSNINDYDLARLVKLIYNEFISQTPYRGEYIKLPDQRYLFNVTPQLIRDILSLAFDKNIIDIIDIPPIINNSNKLIEKIKYIGFFDIFFNDFEMMKFSNCAKALLKVSNNATIISVGNSPFLIVYISKLFQSSLKVIHLPISGIREYCPELDEYEYNQNSKYFVDNIISQINTIIDENNNNYIQQYIKFLNERYPFILEKLESGNEKIIMIDYVLTGSSISFAQIMFYLAMYYKHKVLKKSDKQLKKIFELMYENFYLKCFRKQIGFEIPAEDKLQACIMFSESLAKLGIDYKKITKNNRYIDVKYLPEEILQKYENQYKERRYLSTDENNYIDNMLNYYLTRYSLNYNNANEKIKDEYKNMYYKLSNVEKQYISEEGYINQQLLKLNKFDPKNYDDIIITMFKNEIRDSITYRLDDDYKNPVPYYIIDNIDIGRCVISYKHNEWIMHNISIIPINVICFLIRLYINSYFLKESILVGGNYQYCYKNKYIKYKNKYLNLKNLYNQNH